MAESYSIVFIHYVFFMYSCADGNLGSFHILAMGNNAAMNIGCIYLSDLVFLLSSDIHT